jgi:integrase
MASISKRKSSDGKISYLAQVRIRPYKPTSKTFSKLADAKTWAKELEEDLKHQRKQGAVSKDVTRLTVEGLINQFLEDPDTEQLKYHDTLSILLAWWSNEYGNTRILDLNVLTLREAREKLQDGRTPATVNRYLSALRSCWNWGRAAGLVPQDHRWPTRLLLREDNERQRYLTDNELKQLIEAAEDHSHTMHAAVVLSVACGLRQGELLNLKWQDIDLDAQRIRILRSKTDQARTVFLPASAVAALRALKRQSVISTKAVFLSESGEALNRGTIRIRWLVIRDAAGLKDFRWHDMRHSCASFLAQNGATLLEIGSVLGHRSTSVTRRYAHLVEGAPVTGHDALDKILGDV